MNPQARKNIRQAFPSIVHLSREWEATQCAARWVEAGAQSFHTCLSSLDLLDIAHRCLVEGETLEDVGASGPYGTAAQRRAWAAGRLAAACCAIHVAEELSEERKEYTAAIAKLKRDLDYARAETRAAARFKDLDIPFRAPRRQKSVDWDAA